ncbi:response regulator transcription factor [Mycobacterium sp. NPDC003323]
MSTSVLIVDDDAGICDLLECVLELSGYAVVRAGSGAEAVAVAAATPVDLALIDLGLPDVDGASLIPRIRGYHAAAGIILLTARNDIESKVEALRGGADDYVTKPFHPTEVLARIEAVLRRSRSGDSDGDGECVTYADLTVDMQRLTVRRGQQAVALTPTELRLLVYLMRNAERVVSRGQILDQVWQYDFRGEGMVVEKVVSNLRKKIDAGGEPLIHTVRGFGYSLRRCAG